MPQDLLDVSFRVSRRGYDREAVDAYVKRVNRVIAELKVRSSPPAAVRHALDQAEAKVQRERDRSRGLAFFVWGALHSLYVPGWRNGLSVNLNWIWSYATQ